MRVIFYDVLLFTDLVLPPSQTFAIGNLATGHNNSVEPRLNAQ